MESDRNAKRRAQRAANPEKYRAAEKAHRDKNRERRNALANEWKKRNPEKVREANRKHKFGVTQEEWDAQFEVQGQTCAICGADHPGGPKDWATDHDHKTGRLRGILCHHCNKAIGHVGDNIEVLRAAAAYLQTFRDLWDTTR